MNSQYTTNLIKKDDIDNEIQRIYDMHYQNANSQTIHDIFHAVFRAIRRAPTVDIIETAKIVKCDKCQFWDREHISCEGLAKCQTGEGGIRYRSATDFCSRGIDDN